MKLIDPTTVQVVEHTERKSHRRGCVGVAIFWSVFVLIFTAIFYLSYLFLLSHSRPSSLTETALPKPDKKSVATTDNETAAVGDKKLSVRNGANKTEKPTKTNSRSNVESTPERNISPFSDVFDNEDQDAVDKKVSVSTLRQWRNKLQSGLEQLDKLSETNRRDFGVFVVDTMNYAKYHSKEAAGEERELLDELRTLAGFALDDLEEHSSAKPMIKNDYLREPFDDSIESVPTGFMGHDIAEIASTLYSRIDPDIAHKREESDREYRMRLDRIKSAATTRNLVGTLKYSSRLAFVLPNFEGRWRNGTDSVEIRYSMSRKTATVLKNEYYSEVSLYRRLYYDYDSRSDKLPTLSFTSEACEDNNVRPFGIRYIIPESFQHRVLIYGLAIKLDKKFKERAYTRFQLRLGKLPPEKGEEIARFGRVLCICSLDPEGTKERYSLRVSKGDVKDGRSVAYSQEDHLITVTNCEFWLYSEKTGEIFAKYSGDDALNGKTYYYKGEDDN